VCDSLKKPFAAAFGHYGHPDSRFRTAGIP